MREKFVSLSQASSDLEITKFLCLHIKHICDTAMKWNIGEMEACMSPVIILYADFSYVFLGGVVRETFALEKG